MDDDPWRALAEQLFGPLTEERRDLGNARALMLRPPCRPWFHARLSDVVWIEREIDESWKAELRSDSAKKGWATRRARAKAD